MTDPADKRMGPGQEMRPNLLDGVELFMGYGGQGMAQWPADGDCCTLAKLDELRDLRIGLLGEEFKEYLDKGEDQDDIVEIVDGLLDVIVVAWGTLLTYVGSERAKAAAAEVTRSNLTKVIGPGLPVLREDGKIMKPEGWTPPDIAGAIAMRVP